MLRVPTSTLTDAIPGLVFVKAPGRSTTIREGRSILAALQSCGEVVTFNNIPVSCSQISSPKPVRLIRHRLP